MFCSTMLNSPLYQKNLIMFVLFSLFYQFNDNVAFLHSDNHTPFTYSQSVVLRVEKSQKSNSFLNLYTSDNNKRFYSTNEKKPVSKNKIYFKRILTGVKLSFKSPSFSEKVSCIHNNIFIRIFRVLGGISIVSCFSGTAE